MLFQQTLKYSTFMVAMIFSSILASAQSDFLITRKTNPDRSVTFFYEKELYGTYHVVIDVKGTSNCSSGIYHRNVSGPSGTLFTLKPIDRAMGIGYSYKTRYIRGKLNPKIDSLFAYILPHTTGTEVQIIESSNLSEKYFGNKKQEDWKYYSMYTRNADTICAARKGLIIEITDKYDGISADDSLYRTYTSERNGLKIEHDDGTIAIYNGLRKGSLMVDLGDMVYPLTPLGVVDMYNQEQYRFNFCVKYLMNSQLMNPKKSTIKDKIQYYSYITPRFFVNDRAQVLMNKNKYCAICNEEIVTEEFSRREKKRYQNKELKNCCYLDAK